MFCTGCTWHHQKGEKCVNPKCSLGKKGGESATEAGGNNSGNRNRGGRNERRPFKTQEVIPESSEYEGSDIGSEQSGSEA